MHETPTAKNLTCFKIKSTVFSQIYQENLRISRFSNIHQKSKKYIYCNDIIPLYLKTSYIVVKPGEIEKFDSLSMEREATLTRTQNLSKSG